MWIARAFFSAASACSTCSVLSVFWSLMADIFCPEQAKRLYGFLAAGPAPAACWDRSSPQRSRRSSARSTCCCSRWCFSALRSSAFAIDACGMRALLPPTRPASPDGGRGREPAARAAVLWAGFALVANSPYLLSISAFVAAADLGLARSCTCSRPTWSRGAAGSRAQTQLFGWLDFIVQAMALLIAAVRPQPLHEVDAHFDGDRPWRRSLMVFGYSALGCSRR